MTKITSRNSGSIHSSEVSLSSLKLDSRQKFFFKLLTERRIFPTPWHWCVHGLGLGQETSGFSLVKSSQILAISQALVQKSFGNYYVFSDHLINSIVTTCTAKSLDKQSSEKLADEQFKSTIQVLESLRGESWLYPRACAVLTESLVKLESLELYQDEVYQHLSQALKHIVKLNPVTDKLCYEKSQLLANLLLAAGQAGFEDLFTAKQSNGNTYIDEALELVNSISDIFYRGRGSAIIFSVLSIIGHGNSVTDSNKNHLQTLLDLFDEELSNSFNRNSDGVHEGTDYYIFPLSLILNAIAVLDCPEYLTYKRDWVKEAASLFNSLSSASQTSQITFFVSALDNLGLLEIHVPNLITLLEQCLARYLNSTDGLQVDDYLRCTYLIHLADQLNRSDIITPRIWTILSNSLTRAIDDELYRQSSYGSSYMVAAYLLSAFDKSDSLNLLFNEPIGFPQVIHSFENNYQAATIYAPRIVFALVDIALRMRPVDTSDTLLFKDRELSKTVVLHKQKNKNKKSR